MVSAVKVRKLFRFYAIGSVHNPCLLYDIFFPINVMRYPILLFAGITVLVTGCCNGDFIIPQPEDEIADVTLLINDCSADHGFTTVNGSAAASAGSCWNVSGPSVSAKRFKFTATPSGEVSIIVQTGSEYGTQTRTNVVLLDTDGTTELDCETWSVFQDELATIILYYSDLVPGETYFFNVDVQNLAGAGTFKLCLTDTD
jgi:hypothetical protein